MRYNRPPLRMRQPPLLLFLLLNDPNPGILVLGRDLLREDGFEVVAVLNFEDGEHAALGLVEEVLRFGIGVCDRTDGSVGQTLVDCE